MKKWLIVLCCVFMLVGCSTPPYERKMSEVKVSKEGTARLRVILPDVNSRDYYFYGSLGGCNNSVEKISENTWNSGNLLSFVDAYAENTYRYKSVDMPYPISLESKKLWGELYIPANKPFMLKAGYGSNGYSYGMLEVVFIPEKDKDYEFEIIRTKGAHVLLSTELSPTGRKPFSPAKKDEYCKK